MFKPIRSPKPNQEYCACGCHQLMHLIPPNPLEIEPKKVNYTINHRNNGCVQPALVVSSILSHRCGLARMYKHWVTIMKMEVRVTRRWRKPMSSGRCRQRRPLGALERGVLCQARWFLIQTATRSLILAMGEDWFFVRVLRINFQLLKLGSSCRTEVHISTCYRSMKNREELLIDRTVLAYHCVAYFSADHTFLFF